MFALALSHFHAWDVFLRSSLSCRPKTVSGELRSVSPCHGIFWGFPALAGTCRLPSRLVGMAAELLRLPLREVQHPWTRRRQASPPAAWLLGEEPPPVGCQQLPAVGCGRVGAAGDLCRAGHSPGHR